MESPKRLAAHWPPLFVGAVFVACIFGTCPLMDAFQPREYGAILVYTCFGVIGAAAALVAICGVLWPSTFWLRMLTSFGAGLLLVCAWLIGFAISSVGKGRLRVQDELTICTIIFLCLPLAFLAIQLPLWLTRLVFRWDVVLVSQAIESPPMDPLSIRDLLTATGLSGFGLAVAKFARQHADQEQFWIYTAVGLASCVGISLLSTLPLVVATLRAKKPVVAMIGISIYAVIILVTTFTVMGIIERRLHRPWYFVGLSTTVAAFTGAIAVPLLMVRQRGFRLRWGRESLDQIRTASPDSSDSR